MWRLQEKQMCSLASRMTCIKSNAQDAEMSLESVLESRKLSEVVKLKPTWEKKYMVVDKDLFNNFLFCLTQLV